MLNINRTPTQIINDMTLLIQNIKNATDAIANNPDCSFNIIKELSLMASDNHKLISELTFLKQVSPDANIREASLKASQMLQDFSIENSMRLDIFNKIKCVMDTKEQLDEQDAKLLQEYYKNCIDLGLDLPENKRNLLSNIRKQIAELESNYSTNIAEDNAYIILTTDELEGLPDDYLQRTLISDDEHKITMEYPDYFPIMSSCSISNTRKQVEHMFENRVPQNIEILSMLLKLRTQYASVLGYKNYAELAVKDNMACTPYKALELLQELSMKIKDKVKDEYDVLRKLKGADLETYDYGYYLYEYKKQSFDVDHDLIKEYFPIKYVVQNIFKLYEDLFGLRIDKVDIKQDYKWHDELRYYSVADVKTKNILGYFYMDLFSRNGKFSHAAVFDLISPYQKRDGTYQLPVCALVTNFTKPIKGIPSLLKHNEVTGTFLHELGHVIHFICSGNQKYSYFSGFQVPIDFVETPSQMMENFAFDKDVLKRLSCHYITKEPLPDELIDNLIKTQKIGKASDWIKTIYFGLYDLEVHLYPKNYTKQELLMLFRCFQKEFSLMSNDNQRIATWGHIGGSHYASNYYCYTWSKVIAVDLYTKFKGANQAGASQADNAVGLKYRKHILEPGFTQHPTKLIQNFLERDFTTNSFLQQI